MNLTQRVPLPDREELHREFAGVIYPSDFNTNYPNPFRNITHTHMELYANRTGVRHDHK